MKKYWLRSTIFNLAFYFVTLIACIICLPTLFMPRAAFMAVVHGWVWCVHVLERVIMNLHFEIRGLEHLPADGQSYIVAAKHQSPYETFKLHTLFGDPAIILKQELLKIPLWGAYLKKSDVIAIDRTTPELAISSIQEGARRMKQQGRPIIIFPQGTRVRVDETVQHKPYKVGVARLQEATDLPILPMALNTGYFWPRSGWLRKPGRVVFEFLPPVMPGMDRSALLGKLERDVEAKSKELLDEAIEKENAPKDGVSKLLIFALFAIVSLCVSYTVYWHLIADKVAEQHSLFLIDDMQGESLSPDDFTGMIRRTSGATISGFPGPLVMDIEQEYFETLFGSLTLEDITAQSFPFPGLSILVDTGLVIVQPRRFSHPLLFETLKADITPSSKHIEIDYAYLKKGDFQMLLKGTIAQDDFGRPLLNLTLSIEDHDYLIDYLISEEALDDRMALFVRAGMQGLERDGVVEMPIHSTDGKVYAGPFFIGTMPVPPQPAPPQPPEPAIWQNE